MGYGPIFVDHRKSEGRQGEAECNTSGSPKKQIQKWPILSNQCWWMSKRLKKQVNLINQNAVERKRKTSGSGSVHRIIPSLKRQSLCKNCKKYPRFGPSLH